MGQQIPLEHRRGLDAGWGEERGDWIVPSSSGPYTTAAGEERRYVAYLCPPADFVGTQSPWTERRYCRIPGFKSSFAMFRPNSTGWRRSPPP